MPQGSQPDLPLSVRPDDQVLFVANCAWKNRFGRAEPSSLYVVVHREPAGSWTHIYRVVLDAFPGRAIVYLEAALEGERLHEGRKKALMMLERQTGLAVTAGASGKQAAPAYRQKMIAIPAMATSAPHHACHAG
ncbi:hypothetical protein [Microvirga terricola]|uniref:Uncharacterized protein n=1 Tax=Microvirga terricola TaxID=2719797 RepID=A0ABX0VAZ7_9HYPH|nr:hypothetical protein [Microvirga terricola]NIX77020.1 hypothetical protein [Microvirga terricola]